MPEESFPEGAQRLVVCRLKTEHRRMRIPKVNLVVFPAFYRSTPLSLPVESPRHGPPGND